MRAGSPLPGVRTLPYLPGVKALRIRVWGSSQIVDPGLGVQGLWDSVKSLLS